MAHPAADLLAVEDFVFFVEQVVLAAPLPDKYPDGVAVFIGKGGRYEICGVIEYLDGKSIQKAS